jgi:hypothetical protein
MKYSTAVKVAIQSMQREKKVFNFDANLYVNLGVRTPSAENAHRRMIELNEAIAILQGQPVLEYHIQ